MDLCLLSGTLELEAGGKSRLEMSLWTRENEGEYTISATRPEDKRWGLGMPGPAYRAFAWMRNGAAEQVPEYGGGYTRAAAEARAVPGRGRRARPELGSRARPSVGGQSILEGDGDERGTDGDYGGWLAVLGPAFVPLRDVAPVLGPRTHLIGASRDGPNCSRFTSRWSRGRSEKARAQCLWHSATSVLT